MTLAGGAGRRPRSSRASARLRRLIEEALVDAYGEDEQHGAFLVMFEEHVQCPFTALVVGEEVEVRGFDWAGAPHEIVAVCRRQGRTHRVNVTPCGGLSSARPVRSGSTPTELGSRARGRGPPFPISAAPPVASLVGVLGVTGWMAVAGVTPGALRELAQAPYGEAVRALGAPERSLLWRHFVPNVLGVIAVAGLVELNRAMLAEATVSFLGFGLSPPTPTWGSLLIGAQDHVLTAPWLALALALTGASMLLHDASRPRSGRRRNGNP